MFRVMALLLLVLVVGLSAGMLARGAADARRVPSTPPPGLSEPLMVFRLQSALSGIDPLEGRIHIPAWFAATVYCGGSSGSAYVSPGGPGFSDDGFLKRIWMRRDIYCPGDLLAGFKPAPIRVIYGVKQARFYINRQGSERTVLIRDDEFEVERCTGKSAFVRWRRVSRNNNDRAWGEEGNGYIPSAGLICPAPMRSAAAPAPTPQAGDDAIVMDACEADNVRRVAIRSALRIEPGGQAQMQLPLIYLRAGQLACLIEVSGLYVRVRFPEPGAQDWHEGWIARERLQAIGL